MQHILSNWFVRQSVVEKLEEHIFDIVSMVLDLEIKWYGEDEESAESLADCLLMFFDLGQMTGDEVHYVLQHVAFYAGMGLLYRLDKLTDEQAEELGIPKSLKISELGV